MTPKKNYLLVGNSRLHWAEKINQDLKFSHSLLSDELPRTINFNNLIWASVGHYPTVFLNKRNEIKTHDINMHKIPTHFGVDRALACFAAFNHIENVLNKNIVIADFGTTLSITKINQKGNVIGGLLIPGFMTQLKSLEQNTRNLEIPNDLSIPEENFLLSTERAMVKGVYKSLEGAIHSSYNEDKDILVFCGGDADLIGKKIKEKINNVIIEPNLAMIGMILFNELT